MEPREVSDLPPCGGNYAYVIRSTTRWSGRLGLVVTRGHWRSFTGPAAPKSCLKHRPQVLALAGPVWGWHPPHDHQHSAAPGPIPVDGCRATRLLTGAPATHRRATVAPARSGPLLAVVPGFTAGTDGTPGTCASGAPAPRDRRPQGWLCATRRATATQRPARSTARVASALGMLSGSYSVFVLIGSNRVRFCATSFPSLPASASNVMT